MNNNIIEQVKTFIANHQLLKTGDRVVVGVSGGPDSIFLLHFLSKLHNTGTITVIAAHLNHGWRPEAADDAAWVQQYANTLGIEYVLGSLKDIIPDNVKKTGSLEEQGRRARRIFFEQIAHDYNCSAIALGHHADDQLETFFLRLIRGTTISGLVGMKPRTGLYVRPLLEITKSAIVAYLHENNIPYLIDHTNTSNVFLRNRIRQELLPILTTIDRRFPANLQKLMSRIADTEKFLIRQTHIALDLVTLTQKTTIHNRIVDRAKFKNVDNFLQPRILLAWIIESQLPFVPSEPFLDELLRFIHSSGGGSHKIMNTWALIKKNNQLSIIGLHNL